MSTLAPSLPLYEVILGCCNGTAMEVLINAANVLYLLSYFVRDILRLRVLTVVAATCLTVYFYCLPEPLMVAVYWNLCFIGLNLFRIARRPTVRRDTRAKVGPSTSRRLPALRLG